MVLYRTKKGSAMLQAPADGCHCKPLIKKLEGQLQATQEEMRLQIQNVQEQVNCRLGKMDRRNRHQQAAVSHELKNWCTSQIRDMDLHIPTQPQYYKLLPSPSVDQSLADGDLESLPLLSVVSGDSSSSLATYVNVVPFPSSYNLVSPDQEQTASRKYFEVKVNRSPVVNLFFYLPTPLLSDNYENTALIPLPAKHTSGVLVGPADPYWQPAGVQDTPKAAAIVALSGEGCSSSASSSRSNSSSREPRRTQHRQHRKHRREPIGAHGTRTLEFFIDRPPEPTFSQERNNLHAVEVTQRFFETVSTQLERWYERKILEAKQQTELRAQQDRKQLLQRISRLEEELQRLKTNGNAESS
uniref:ankyrin repeat domain-containing protein 6-like n=1 Tax=Centroberyx gerrardi TaxID=166262 RepID=UPI003AAF7A8F